MKFNIYPVEKPSIVDSLYDEMCEWVGFIEDESRKWWVAYKDCEPFYFHNTSVSPNWTGFAGIQLDKDAKRAMMTPCEVKPEFRGHGLQKKFLQVREDWCRYNGYLTLNSLTLTDNIYSINNLIACGYRLRKPFYASNGKGLYWEKKL